MNYHIGFIGLGHMGQNMVLHLIEQGIHVSIYNRTQTVTDSFLQIIEDYKQKEHITPSGLLGTLKKTTTIKELVSTLPDKKIIFLMVKAGEAVDEVIGELLVAGVQSGDILIDGGNSFFEDSKKRCDALSAKEIVYIDCGTSGGLQGARYGACLMLGGQKEQVEQLSWLWNALAGKQQKNCACGGSCSHNQEHECQCGGNCGHCKDHKHHHDIEDLSSLGTWTYFGPSGAGHFVKMVHNGVEYGMNQAIGEGFHMLAEGPYKLDLHEVAENWSQGSVVRGWLIELLERALAVDPKLDRYKGIAGGGQTGQWVLDTSKKHNIPQPILEQSVKARIQSKQRQSFATKVVSALRFEYGGHKEEIKG